MDKPATEAPLDVMLYGSVFLDIVFTGIPSLPQAGTEIYADGMGSSPGGVANMAVASARLGLQTALATAFGDDAYGDFLWHTLADQERIDLSASRQFTDWHTPVTISMAYNRDRAMLTHEHPSPVPISELLQAAPTTRAAIVSISSECDLAWAKKRKAEGMLLVGDTGWDPSGEWNTDALEAARVLDVFLPNSAEAMAYTRTEDPRAALMDLADYVPCAIVTCGGQGSIGLDGNTGEEEWVPALPVNAVDATGAGDNYTAAFLAGTLRGWPLRQRMAFGNLCAGLAVQQVGGSLAAPGWGDISDWYDSVKERSDAGSRAAHAMRHSYEFLDDVLSGLSAWEGHTTVRRATATIGRLSDA